MLAAGFKQVEVAEHLGVTPPAVYQRMKRAKREWEARQDVEPEGTATPDQ